MPEIKTKHKSQPVLNTAQQQMQRGFVRAKQEQAVHRQSEQSESPSNYAEEKVSRTAEDTVRDAGSLLQHEIRSVRHRDSTPKSTVSAENAGRQEVAREVFQNRREVRGRATQDTASIRTREHVTDNSVAESGIFPAQQAARKAAAQDIIGRKKQQKEEELGFERTHFSQQVEATQASPCTSKASDTVVTESAQVSNGFHNTFFLRVIPPGKRKSRSRRNPTCPFVLGILPFRSRPPREPQRKCPTQPQNMLPRKPKRPPPLLRKKVFMPQPPLDAGLHWLQKRPQS